MGDLFTEIWESIRRNKLRTCLTGFAVAWGIFMLIVLLGAGNGLLNSFNLAAGGISVNTMSVYGGYTGKAYDGLSEGRSIELNEGDAALTASPAFSKHIDEVLPVVRLYRSTVSRGRYHFTGMVEGTFPSRLEMEKIDILAGRFLNPYDISRNRKVIVLPQNRAEELVPEGTPVSRLVGQTITAGGTTFKVIGIIKSDRTRDDNRLYAPYTTVKLISGAGREIDQLDFSFHGLETEAQNEAFEQEYRAAINARHRAAPDDPSAIWISNHFTQSMQMNRGTRILTIGLWIIGLFTLLGGIVGVSNIMLITVKERTHEFGIRKAIGATPWSVTRLIIAESVAITAFFGYIGMVLGMLACGILDKAFGGRSIEVLDETITAFVDPTVGLDVALEATLVLIIAGTLAGLFPALKATKVKPIEALRAE